MESKEKSKYERAKKKVEDIKGFYTHLSIYLVINGLMLLAALGIFEGTFIPFQFPDWSYFTTPFFGESQFLSIGCMCLNPNLCLLGIGKNAKSNYLWRKKKKIFRITILGIDISRKLIDTSTCNIFYF